MSIERMDEAQALVRALTWFSPAFPVGAFSYSHGIESAVDAGLITDDDTLRMWVEDILTMGSGWSDAVLLARTIVGDDVAEVAAALPPTVELELEADAQGAAFARAAGVAAAPLPIAVGRAARGVDMPSTTALLGYLHGLSANLVSAGVRLIPLGQTAGLAVLTALEPVVLATANRAASASLNDIASSCLTVEWCSMRHEIQHTRLFRS